MPDREVAARLAGLRRAGVDLERRMRGDNMAAPDSETYWHSQIHAWRTGIEGLLTNYPFQLRALQQPMPLSPDEDAGWAREALREVIEVRSRLDLTIERLARED